MKHIEEVVQGITERIFEKVDYPYCKKLMEIQKLSNEDKEIFSVIFKLEEINSKKDNAISEISFAKGLLYGIGFCNKIKDIDINNF